MRTRRFRSARVTAGFLAAVLAASVASGQQLSVGAGSSVDLGSGTLDLGCANLAVSGSLGAGAGTVDQALDVSIAPGGTLNGEMGTLNLTRDWTNSGTFNAGTSTVNFVDGCGSTLGVISGDTTFADLSMTTSTGKEYRFAAGSTQTVTNSLTLLGAAGNLLTIRSTLGGSEAFLSVQGTSSADFVDVQDNDASAGNPITLGPDSVAGPNTAGWNLNLPVPSLSLLGRILFALLVLWVGSRTSRVLLPRRTRWSWPARPSFW